MYALRERRVHVTQEDFELAVAKVKICIILNSYFFYNSILGYAKRFREECFIEKTLEVINLVFFLSSNLFPLKPFLFCLLLSKKPNKSRDKKKQIYFNE
jgi:hypothetical protein